MDLKFFYSNYDLSKEKVTKISSNGECLEIFVEFDIYINYIGNGLRSEFDYKPTHKFVIKEKYETFTYEFPKILSYSFEDGKVKISLEDRDITISSNEIECYQNLEVK